MPTAAWADGLVRFSTISIAGSASSRSTVTAASPCRRAFVSAAAWRRSAQAVIRARRELAAPRMYASLMLPQPMMPMRTGSMRRPF